MHRLSVALTALLLLSPPVFGEQKVTAGKGGVAVGIQGDHNNVSLNDPEVRRLVAEVLKKQKADDFLKGQVTRSQAEADALKKENEALKQQLALPRPMPRPRNGRGQHHRPCNRAAGSLQWKDR